MRIACASAAVCALAFAAIATAQPENRGPNRDAGGPSVESVIAEVVFGAAAEREIRDYYAAHHYEPQTLPPGIARNLERGKPLPPGIAKRFAPDDLLSRLPQYPGHDILLAGDKILLVDAATQVIADVLSNVF